MTSTFLGYKIYANNFAQSLQRVAAEPSNASDQKYFEANIGKVKSVDDFVNNYRLFTYAMKAYGLSDLGNAKALMKKVLDSDLTNSHSFANSLNDSRYLAFAKAFNFTTTGGIASSSQAQTSSQQQDTITRMNLDASATAGLRATLAAVTSVQSFESNSSLYSQVLSAYGLNASTTSQSDVTAALESNLSDPNSFANRSNETKLRPLAEAFNFGSDGNVASQHMLQSAQNIVATQQAYSSHMPTDAKSQAAAATETAYYAQKMPEMTSVDQMLSDTRLATYVKTAFGLPSTTTTAQLRSVLTSNLLDPKSVANTLGVDAKVATTGPTNYQLLASAFSIGADGTAWDHQLVIASSNLTAATTAYTASVAVTAASQNATTSKATIAAGQTETDYFNTTAPTVKSVSALLADTRLVAYIRTAYNLPAPTTTTVNGHTTTSGGTSLADLKSILTSDMTSSTSAANTMGSAAHKLATAFNFTTSGLVYSERPIQNAKNIAATTAAYQAQTGTDATSKANATAETDYYTSTIPRMKSVDDILSDKRLVAYLTKAYNLPTTQTATLRQVLTSNLLVPTSKANTLGGGYQTMAAAFDISSDGSITHAADQQAQSKTGIAATHIAYLEEAMETEADQTNDGVRLALYFKRMAPTITSAYGILADKALTSVVQTMLGLPATASAADIDSQAKTITDKINISDFKDPAKLDKLIARFATLYDVKNGTTDTSSITALFGSSS